MDRCWTLTHPDILVYRRFDAPSDPNRLAPAQAAAQVRDWLATQPRVMTDAHDAVVARPSNVLPAARDERRLMLERGLEAAFERGELVALRVPVIFPVRKVERPLENVLGPQQVVDEVPPDLTWIAIELVDDADPPAPVPHARYQIELSDGSVETGSLDADGAARLDRVVRGPAKVRFPDLDGAAWRQA